MAKKGQRHPYKGIPRDQWPAARLARGEEPLAAGAQERNPNSIPLSDVPRETFIGEHTQPVYAPNPRAVILPNAVKTEPQPGHRDYSMGAGPQGTTDVRRKPDATFSAPKIDTTGRQTEDGLPRTVPPPNLFAKGVKALEVFSLDGDPTDPLPGFRLHWFVDENDSGARLKQAEMSGWAFVNDKEVMVSDTISNGSTNLGNHIRKLASKSSATYQYLMKKPLEIEEAHQADYRNRVILPIKQALKRGQISNNPKDMQYAHRDHQVDDHAKTYHR